MKTEKETIREILVNWGVIKNGVFSKAQFDKNVNADWLRKKVLAYGFDKEIPDTDEPLKPVPDVCSKCGKNPCECEAEPAPVEAPVVDTPVVEAPAEVVETVEAHVEEAPADETPADETPAKKKAAKKK